MIHSGIQVITKGWMYLWFQDRNTVPLEVMRIGLGLLMCFNYGLYQPADVLALYADSGLIKLDTIPEARTFMAFSIFAYLDQDWQVLTFHYIFVILCFCFAVGWQTRWIKWLILAGQMSYFNRNEFAFYGVDTVLIALLLVLCIAPLGSAMSLDRFINIKRYRRIHGQASKPELPTSQTGFACQRLLQIQMAIIYLSSGYEKLSGELWLSGEAPWYVLVNYSTAFTDAGFFAQQFWIIKVMAYLTLVLEIVYAFLIWDRRFRPYILAGAVLLHLCIAVFLGIVYFSLVMIVGHLVFMRRHWYASFADYWNLRINRLLQPAQRE